MQRLDRTRPSRRNALQRAAAGGLLVGAAPRLLPGASSEAIVVPGVRRVRSVVVVFTSGGQSQLEMWDPKPEAPLEIRGEFRAIPTSVPGTLLGEHMPRLAALAHRFTLIRSMSHADVDHGSAVYLSLTGQYHSRITSNPPVSPTDLPSIPSVFRRLRPHAGRIDPSIQINGPAIVAPADIAPGQFGGLLGREYDPLFIGDTRAGDVALPGLVPLVDLSAARIADRIQLRNGLAKATSSGMPPPRWEMVFDGRYQRAVDLVLNPETQAALRLGDEPPEVRDRYGRSRGGQACLLARRLVEAGVPLITVIWNHLSRGQDDSPDDEEAYGWDTHNDIFASLRERLLPRFDRSFSALLEDLHQRGLLEDTLVICMGEFGRAPQVALEPRFKGATPGRKHWASAYSILMAGGGTAPGKIVGRTDRYGAWPASESYGPWDVAATIMAALGVDPESLYYDPQSRPYHVSVGKPILAAYKGS